MSNWMRKREEGLRLQWGHVQSDVETAHIIHPLISCIPSRSFEQLIGNTMFIYVLSLILSVKPLKSSLEHPQAIQRHLAARSARNEQSTIQLPMNDYITTASWSTASYARPTAQMPASRSPPAGPRGKNSTWSSLMLMMSVNCVMSSTRSRSVSSHLNTEYCICSPYPRMRRKTARSRLSSLMSYVTMYRSLTAIPP